MSNQDYLEQGAFGVCTDWENDVLADDEDQRLSTRQIPPRRQQKSTRPKIPTHPSRNGNPKVKLSSKRGVSREKLMQRSLTNLSSISETELSSFDITGSFEVLDFSETILPTTWCVWPQQMLMAAIDEKLFTKSPLNIRLCKPLLNVSLDESVWKEIPSECRDIGVLFAALNGHVAMLTFFLESGGDSNATDLLSRSALHYAASSSSSSAVQCINLLIHYKATVDLLDLNGEATPLFCAAASGRIELVEALLMNGSDVNAGAGNSSALLWAVRARSLPCVTRLIEAGANVNNLQVLSESPIHVAAFQGDADCLKLLLENNADTSVLCGPERMNALHLASLKGNVECLRLLLEASTTDIDKEEAVGRTPLHLAALAQSVESVELLLDCGARHDICDKMKETPLHSAVVKCRRSIDIVKLLVSRGANVNMKNQFCQTPLHIAAINEHSQLAAFLILSGADLSAKNRAQNSALALVARRVPDALSAISRKLDSAIEIAGLDPTDVDCELRLDLQVLVPSGNQQNVGEMAMLTSMIAADQRHMFLHPVIGAFLHLKWMKIRTTFFTSLIFQLCYVLSLSLNIYDTYVTNKNEKIENVTTNSTNYDISTNLNNSTDPYCFWYLTVIFGSMTGCKELFQLSCNPSEYVKDVENYAHIFSIVGMVLALPSSDKPLEEWQTHLAAVVIIVTWINLMMHIGRFPAFGLYVQMFTTVAWNMSKLLVTYFCLIVGFSLGFSVLFPQSVFFRNIPIALLTTIVMMTGEIDFDTLFYDERGNKKMKYDGTTHLVFLSFVLLIVIVLMNLLVGLAVSDIQGLLNSAGLDRLIRITKQIARMEIFIFFPWPTLLPKIWSRIPRRECLQRKVLVVSPKAKRTYNFKPNDPRDRRFPPDIKEGLLAIAVQRMANKKKGSHHHHDPSVRSTTALQVDGHHGELITNVLHRVDALFMSYMSEIATMNKTINEKLELLEDAHRFRPSRKSRPCHHPVILEEFS